MNYEIEINQSYDKTWIAMSKAKLEDTPEGVRYLELRTSKARGGISTNASVFVYSNGDNGFSSKTTEIFGDFSKSKVAFAECKRVTEKAVLEAHKHAMSNMESLIEEAKSFYANKEAEEA